MAQNRNKQVSLCPSSDGNVHWLRRGEWHWVCAVRLVKVRKKRDRRTDTRPLHYSYR